MPGEHHGEFQMTKPALTLGGIKKPAVWEYVLRFVFGGAVRLGALALAGSPR
jgi:hypothetical protein